jgi:hypothetical protein
MRHHDATLGPWRCHALLEVAVLRRLAGGHPASPWTMLAFAVASEVVRLSSASPGTLEVLLQPRSLVASLGLPFACLVVVPAVLGAGGCSRGYMDVIDRDSAKDSGSEGAPADGEACLPDADCAPSTCLDGGCAPATIDWALRFDGVADCARALRPVSKDFTIEAWVVFNATGSGSYWWEGLPVFWSDRDSQASDFSATLLNGTLHFVTGSPSGDAIVSSKSTIPTSQWVHLAVARTMSTGAVTLFINGQADVSGTGTTVALAGQEGFWIFCSDTGLHTPGIIDELRAWNVARSEAAIQATMHQRLAGNEPGLVGYWRFDDGSGTSAADISPTGNPLLLGATATDTVPTWVVSTAPIEAP